VAEMENCCDSYIEGDFALERASGCVAMSESVAAKCPAVGVEAVADGSADVVQNSS